MAKYHASPRYKVGSITFDHFGDYTTDKAEEITQLDALAPKWITRVDVKTEDDSAGDQAEVKVEKAPTKAPAKPRKANATSSAK